MELGLSTLAGLPECAEILAVYGETRSGKSHFVRVLLDKLERREGRVRVEVINANNRGVARPVLQDVFLALWRILHEEVRGVVGPSQRAGFEAFLDDLELTDLGGAGELASREEGPRDDLLRVTTDDAESRAWVTTLVARVLDPRVFRAFAHVLPYSFRSPVLAACARYREHLKARMALPMGGDGTDSLEQRYVPSPWSAPAAVQSNNLLPRLLERAPPRRRCATRCARWPRPARRPPPSSRGPAPSKTARSSRASPSCRGSLPRPCCTGPSASASRPSPSRWRATG